MKAEFTSLGVLVKVEDNLLIDLSKWKVSNVKDMTATEANKKIDNLTVL